jgi:hypothetical protein
MLYKLRFFKPVNNRGYNPINKRFAFNKKKRNTDIVNYSLKDEGMEPEILIGQRVIVLIQNYVFNENDIYLVMSPYGELVRRVKMISNESVQLIASNKKCNSEIFLFDDVQIIGKVKIC